MFTEEQGASWKNKKKQTMKNFYIIIMIFFPLNSDCNLEMLT